MLRPNESQQDEQMTKKTAGPRELADALITTASCISSSHFRAIAVHAFQDSSPGEVAAVANYLPKRLRDLLPVKHLH